MTSRVERVARWVRSRLPLGRRRRPEPLPPVLLALEVSRLAEHVRHVEESDLLHKGERLLAARLAYDLALRDYCLAVGVILPDRPSTGSSERRFDMESALIGAGHEW